MPVTCQETFTPGLLVLMMKLRLAISAATQACAGLADGRQLIPEIRVERFEPTGHRHDGGAAAVGDDIAIVDVHHVRRFDERVVEVFVGGIERMIDFEGAPGLC
jgi:hypothetical protein